MTVVENIKNKYTRILAHIKVSTNGHLRIFHARLEDAGVYECFADNLVGNVTLM